MGREAQREMRHELRPCRRGMRTRYTESQHADAAHCRHGRSSNAERRRTCVQCGCSCILKVHSMSQRPAHVAEGRRRGKT
eukprot:3113809-Prymnesium_polylepis.2